MARESEVSVVAGVAGLALGISNEFPVSVFIELLVSLDCVDLENWKKSLYAIKVVKKGITIHWLHSRFHKAIDNGIHCCSVQTCTSYEFAHIMHTHCASFTGSSMIFKSLSKNLHAYFLLKPRIVPIDVGSGEWSDGFLCAVS